MLVQIGNWLYQNAMAIFISAIASLLISKRYYDKANRESVLMMVIFPIVKFLNEKYYTRNDYEALFEINSSYAVKYLRKKERNSHLFPHKQQELVHSLESLQATDLPTPEPPSDNPLLEAAGITREVSQTQSNDSDVTIRPQFGPSLVPPNTASGKIIQMPQRKII